MENKAVIFYGIDLGNVDRTAYMLFDGSNFKEISENEYRELSEKSLQQQERIDFSSDIISPS